MPSTYKLLLAGGIAGIVGNPAEIIMVRMQGDFAKPLEKRLNYKNCFDGLYRVSVLFSLYGIIKLTRSCTNR